MVIAATLSPKGSPSTPLPTALISPASSKPGMNGNPPCTEGPLSGEASPLVRSLALLESELCLAESGLEAIVNRFGEIVLAQVLRDSLGALNPLGSGATGWLLGAADPAIGRVLHRIHQQPACEWTVAQMASVAAMSRTGFALRFADLVGLLPLAYLRRFRNDRASEPLRRQDALVAHIAEMVEYASEAAFCRAFKREAGSTPREWRLSGTAQRG